MTQLEELEIITEKLKDITLSYEAERNLLLAIIAKNLAVIADELKERKR